MGTNYSGSFLLIGMKRYTNFGQTCDIENPVSFIWYGLAGNIHMVCIYLKIRGPLCAIRKRTPRPLCPFVHPLPP